MKLFNVNVSWRYASENFEYGVIQAESEEQAKQKLKEIFPDALSISVYEIEFDNNGYHSVYEH
jgi:hypothetical protein